MGEKQVTTMVLKVDLECYRCYKKIKKVLCKFPQIQDQVYDEKQNTVTIKVVCCSPEKIKEKIIRKAGETLTSIEIKVPEKPKPPKEPEKTKEPPKPKEPEKPKEPPKKEPEKPKDPVESKGREEPKKYEKPRPKEPEESKEREKPKLGPAPPLPSKEPEPIPCARMYCTDCYEGCPCGPCFYGCPPGPPPCYQYHGYYGRPVNDRYGGGRPYYSSRCDYFLEENTGACSIM